MSPAELAGDVRKDVAELLFELRSGIVAELRSSFVGHVPDHFLLADADETPARKARRLLWPARDALRAERLIVDSEPPG